MSLEFISSPERKTVKYDKTIYKCPICNKEYSSKKYVAKHILEWKRTHLFKHADININGKLLTSLFYLKFDTEQDYIEYNNKLEYLYDLAGFNKEFVLIDYSISSYYTSGRYIYDISKNLVSLIGYPLLKHGYIVDPSKLKNIITLEQLQQIPFYKEDATFDFVTIVERI